MNHKYLNLCHLQIVFILPWRFSACSCDYLKSHQWWQKAVSLVPLPPSHQKRSSLLPASALPTFIVWSSAFPFPIPPQSFPGEPAFVFLFPLFEGPSSLLVSFCSYLSCSQSLVLYYLIYSFSLIRDLSPLFSQIFSFQLSSMFLIFDLSLLSCPVRALPYDFPAIHSLHFLQCELSTS